MPLQGRMYRLGEHGNQLGVRYDSAAGRLKQESVFLSQINRCVSAVKATVSSLENAQGEGHLNQGSQGIKVLQG